MMIIVFSNFIQDTPKLGISGPKFKGFYFCTKLYYKTNWKTFVTKNTIVFQNYSPKHPNKVFFVPNLGILVFARNFAIRQVRVH